MTDQMTRRQFKAFTYRKNVKKARFSYATLLHADTGQEAEEYKDGLDLRPVACHRGHRATNPHVFANENAASGFVIVMNADDGTFYSVPTSEAYAAFSWVMDPMLAEAIEASTSI